jgi:hypothetical protein
MKFLLVILIIIGILAMFPQALDNLHVIIDQIPQWKE